MSREEIEGREVLVRGVWLFAGRGHVEILTSRKYSRHDPISSRKRWKVELAPPVADPLRNGPRRGRVDNTSRFEHF